MKVHGYAITLTRSQRSLAALACTMIFSFALLATNSFVLLADYQQKVAVSYERDYRKPSTAAGEVQESLRNVSSTTSGDRAKTNDTSSTLTIHGQSQMLRAKNLSSAEPNVTFNKIADANEGVSGVTSVSDSQLKTGVVDAQVVNRKLKDQVPLTKNKTDEEKQPDVVTNHTILHELKEGRDREGLNVVSVGASVAVPVVRNWSGLYRVKGYVKEGKLDDAEEDDEEYVDIFNDIGIFKTMKPDFDCGCPRTCDSVALNKRNSKFSCINRVKFLMQAYKLNMTDACMAAAPGNNEGPCQLECHPIHCHNKTAIRPKTILNWTRVATVERPKQPFVRYDKVAVVTKVLWPNDLARLKQMLCLFTAAYNRHVNYDIIVFSTVPWTRHQIRELQAVVPQTKLVVAVDSPPLQDQLATMTPEEIDFLYKRCNVKPGENISWFHHCGEPGSRTVANLGYSWQSEFRAYHIWKQPVLANYKYMIWMDSDSHCTKPWPQDPMKLMVENDLVLMFDNFPQGSTANYKLKEKMMKAYNRSVCSVQLTKEGIFNTHECGPNGGIRIAHVHGFHHITNLDFYRNTSNLRFLELLVSDHRFSREWDDQLGVTAPAAIGAPNRSWDYRRHGINMGIHHNGHLDGKERNVAFKYTVFWQKQGRESFVSAREMCDELVVIGD